MEGPARRRGLRDSQLASLERADWGGMDQVQRSAVQTRDLLDQASIPMSRHMYGYGKHSSCSAFPSSASMRRMAKLHRSSSIQLFTASPASSLLCAI